MRKNVDPRCSAQALRNAMFFPRAGIRVNDMQYPLNDGSSSGYVNCYVALLAIHDNGRYITSWYQPGHSRALVYSVVGSSDTQRPVPPPCRTNDSIYGSFTKQSIGTECVIYYRAVESTNGRSLPAT